MKNVIQTTKDFSMKGKVFFFDSRFCLLSEMVPTLSLPCTFPNVVHSFNTCKCPCILVSLSF